MFPIGTQLRALLDKILTDERWDLKFIGMQIIIEGLALAIFNTIKQTTTDPVLKRILTLLLETEVLTCNFGVNYLESFVTYFDTSRKRKREIFV